MLWLPVFLESLFLMRAARARAVTEEGGAHCVWARALCFSNLELAMVVGGEVRVGGLPGSGGGWWVVGGERPAAGVVKGSGGP